MLREVRHQDLHAMFQKTMLGLWTRHVRPAPDVVRESVPSRQTGAPSVVVRESRVSCRDAVPTKVAHALNRSSSNLSPTVAVTQLSPSERRGRCPSFDLLEEASRTLSVHER